MSGHICRVCKLRVGGKGRREKNLQIPCIGNFDRIAQYPHFCNRKCWIKYLLLTRMLGRAGYPSKRERGYCTWSQRWEKRKEGETYLRGAARSFTALQSRHSQELETKPIGVVKEAETSDRKDFVCAIWNLQQSTTGVMETTPAQGKGREGKGSKDGRNVWGRVVAGSYPCLPDGKRPLACTAVKFNGVKSVGQE